MHWDFLIPWYMQELLKASFPHISPKDFLPRAFGLSIVCPRLLQPVVLPLDASGKCPNAFPLSSLSGSHWTNPNTQAWFIENSLSVPLALATFTRKSRFYLHVCQESVDVTAETLTAGHGAFGVWTQHLMSETPKPRTDVT